MCFCNTDTVEEPKKTTSPREADAKRQASNKRLSESSSWHGDKDKLSAEQLLERQQKQVEENEQHVREEDAQVLKSATAVEDAKYVFNERGFGIDSRNASGQRRAEFCYAAKAAAGDVKAQQKMSDLHERVLTAESLYSIHSKHLQLLQFNLRNMKQLVAQLHNTVQDKKYAVAGDLVAEMHSIIDAETKKSSLASQELFHDVLAIKTAQQAADDIRAQSAARLDALRAKTATERNAEFSSWKPIPVGEAVPVPVAVVAVAAPIEVK